MRVQTIKMEDGSFRATALGHIAYGDTPRQASVILAATIRNQGPRRDANWTKPNRFRQAPAKNGRVFQNSSSAGSFDSYR